LTWVEAHEKHPVVATQLPILIRRRKVRCSGRFIPLRYAWAGGFDPSYYLRGVPCSAELSQSMSSRNLSEESARGFPRFLSSTESRPPASIYNHLHRPVQPFAFRPPCSALWLSKPCTDGGSTQWISHSQRPKPASAKSTVIPRLGLDLDRTVSTIIGAGFEYWCGF